MLHPVVPRYKIYPPETSQIPIGLLRRESVSGSELTYDSCDIVYLVFDGVFHKSPPYYIVLGTKIDKLSQTSKFLGF